MDLGGGSNGQHFQGTFYVNLLICISIGSRDFFKNIFKKKVYIYGVLECELIFFGGLKLLNGWLECD